MEIQVFVVRDQFGRFMFDTEDEDRATEAWENGYEVSQSTHVPEPDFR